MDDPAADRPAFATLPRPDNAAGAERRTGVEIEFAGLREEDAARIVRELFGGSVAETAPREITLADTGIGKVEVCLDTAYRDADGSEVAEAVLELGRKVVPVEIVTEPLTRADLVRLDSLVEALRAAGARGTGDGILLGLGLHLNIEVAAETAEAIVPTVRAYALLEDWLRAARPIDMSRRILPFVDPYPRRLVDRLADAAPDWPMAALIDAYLEESPSRNRGLDLLPLLRHLDEARVTAGLSDSDAVKARPAYHYRLPDCRIDEPDWSLADEWNRWCLIERVGANGDLLAALAEAWKVHRAALTTVRPDWARTVDGMLRSSGALTAPA